MCRYVCMFSVWSSECESSLCCALRAAVSESHRLGTVCISTRFGGYWPRHSRDRAESPSLSFSPPAAAALPAHVVARTFLRGGHRAYRWKHYRRGKVCLPSLRLSEGHRPLICVSAPLVRLTWGTASYCPCCTLPERQTLFAAGPWESLMAVQCFITSLIALNLATLPERLARLGKLSTEHFVIKFSVMSSGGTRSVKFEITPGHFFAEPEPTLKLETWKKMPWGRCSPGALQLNGCGDISPAINSGLCSAEPGWICRREPFRGFDLHLCIYSTGGLVLLVRKCLFNSLPYLFKIAQADSVSKSVQI